MSKTFKLSMFISSFKTFKLNMFLISLLPGEMRLQLLTCLGLGSTGSLGSTGRPPGRVGPGRRQQALLLLLLLMGLTFSGRPPGATEEHTIRYNGDVNIGQCCLRPFHCLSLTFTFRADLYNRDVNRGGAIFTDLSPPRLKLRKEDIYEARSRSIYSLRQCINREYVR